MGQLRKKRKRNQRILYFKKFCIFSFLAVLLWTSLNFVERKGHEPAFDKIEMEAAGCPESLIELAERNPETIEFVNDYENYDGNPDDIDISKDVRKGKIPLFLQWDERWGYEKYGDDFLAVTGCGPTCLSMVYCGLTQDTDMNPYTLARKAEADGFYVEGSGSEWSMMDVLAGELGLDVHTVIFDEEHIKTELNQGRPVICVMGPGDFTTTGHFIVLTGVSDDGKIMIHDPNSKINSEKEWALEDLMTQIRNLWSYSY